MAQTHLYTYTHDGLEEFATQVKNLVIDFLAKEKVLSDTEASRLHDNFAVLVRRPSFWSRFFRTEEESDKPLTLYIVEKRT